MTTNLRSRIISAALALICLWLLLLIVGAQVRYSGEQEKMAAMDDRIEGAQRENDRLAHELELMRQPEWLSLLARARLNYKRPDENVVFVYKNDKPDTISQAPTEELERSNLRKWRDWLSGR